MCLAGLDGFRRQQQQDGERPALGFYWPPWRRRPRHLSGAGPGPLGPSRNAALQSWAGDWPRLERRLERCGWLGDSAERAARHPTWEEHLGRGPPARLHQLSIPPLPPGGPIQLYLGPSEEQEEGWPGASWGAGPLAAAQGAN